jgi:hypothetical protein
MNRRWHVSRPSSGTVRVTRLRAQTGSTRKNAGSARSRAAENSPNTCFSTTGGSTPLATRMYGVPPGRSTRIGTVEGTSGRSMRSNADGPGLPMGNARR